MECAVAAERVVAVTQGEVLDGSAEYVRRRMAKFLSRTPGCGHSAHVNLAVDHRRNAPWATLVQADLVGAGHPIRAQVGSPRSKTYRLGRLNGVAQVAASP